MSFPLKLKTIRESKGLSQPQLAELTGISHQSIAGYEQGTASPSWAYLQIIAIALGVSCIDLTDDPKDLASAKSKPKQPKNKK